MSDETLDLRDLLDAPLSQFPDLPNLPGNKWFMAKLIGIKAERSNNDRKTPYFAFAIRITEPGKDVTEGEMAAVKAAGVSLADYTCGTNFYLTKDAMRMFRRFLTSLGIPETVSVREALKLDANGNPTPETVDMVKDTPIMIRTPLPDAQGRVFLRNVECTGVAQQQQTQQQAA